MPTKVYNKPSNDMPMKDLMHRLYSSDFAPFDYHLFPGHLISIKTIKCPGIFLLTELPISKSSYFVKKSKTYGVNSKSAPNVIKLFPIHTNRQQKMTPFGFN